MKDVGWLHEQGGVVDVVRLEVEGERISYLPVVPIWNPWVQLLNQAWVAMAQGG